MKTNQKGNIGEAKIVSYFIQNGYEVYTPFGNGSTCDIILLKDGITERVSVKTTSRKGALRSWQVTLRQRSYKKDVPFNKNQYDILAIYIIPENRIVLFDPEELKTKTTLNIKALL